MDFIAYDSNGIANHAYSELAIRTFCEQEGLTQYQVLTKDDNGYVINTERVNL